MKQRLESFGFALVEEVGMRNMRIIRKNVLQWEVSSHITKG